MAAPGELRRRPLAGAMREPPPSLRGTRIKMRPGCNGSIVLANGEKLLPFGGLLPEGTLPADFFSCKSGQLRSIRLPDKRRKHSVLHLVRQGSTPHVAPVELYYNVADPRKQFILYPPQQDIASAYMLLYRQASRLERNCAWRQLRLLEVGPRHPCWEQRLELAAKRMEEEKLATSKAMAAARAPREGCVPPSESDARAAYESRQVPGEPTPRPVAAEALRSLLAQRWRRASFGSE